MILGAKDRNSKAFPLFDQLDTLLTDEMTDESKAISSNHLPKKKGKVVAIDESDEDITLGGASDECESPLPKEKRKGKRSAQIDHGSATKLAKSSESGSVGSIQSCYDTFNKSVTMGPLNKDHEFGVGMINALKALKVDSSTYATVVKALSKSSLLATVFINFDEAEQRAMIDQYLGK